ncbi:MAG: lipoyl synthase [Fidelibacterota bacterium]
MSSAHNYPHKPSWLKVRIPSGENYKRVRALINHNSLHTVCDRALCPNLGECWGRKTATFMLLGDTCTRNCSFCGVSKGKPGLIDRGEPERVAEAARQLGLRYVVITSVTRDDLPDGGAEIFSEAIRCLREKIPNCLIEVLIPDFKGSLKALERVLEAEPHVLNHNLETVPRLYKKMRPEADYNRSLLVLKESRRAEVITKSGLILGLGEEICEVIEVMYDLKNAGCQILTMGQYLQPSMKNLPVERFLSPSEFEMLKSEGGKIGFQHVEAGPLVRSSFHAEEQVSSLLTH